MYSEIQFKLVRRETATGYPVMAEAITGLQQNCEEETGWAIFEIAGASGPTELPIGSIDKGKFLLLSVQENDSSVREPVSIHLNGSANVSGTGLNFGIEFDDTTGLTSLHITNANTDVVKVKYYVGGDVS